MTRGRGREGLVRHDEGDAEVYATPGLEGGSEGGRGECLSVVACFKVGRRRVRKGRDKAVGVGTGPARPPILPGCLHVSLRTQSGGEGGGAARRGGCGGTRLKWKRVGSHSNARHP